MARKLREIHITGRLTGLLFKKNGEGVMTNETALSMLLPTEHVRRFLEEASRYPNFAEKFPKITTEFQRQILGLFLMGCTIKDVSNYLHIKESDLVSEFNKAIRSITVRFLFSENTHGRRESYLNKQWEFEDLELLNKHVAKKSIAVSIDDEPSESDMENINVGLTFTEEAMNDLNRVAENAVRKAREHNDEIEHLLGQLQALREESSK
jgi:hypothetical protein